jgi:fatty-acid desaturase
MDLSLIAIKNNFMKRKIAIILINIIFFVLFLISGLSILNSLTSNGFLDLILLCLIFLSIMGIFNFVALILSDRNFDDLHNFLKYIR